MNLLYYDFVFRSHLNESKQCGEKFCSGRECALNCILYGDQREKCYYIIILLLSPMGIM